MTAPYRKPDVPTEVVAERRFDARVSELSGSSAAELASDERRRRRRKRALCGATVLFLLYALGAVIVRAFVHGPSFGWLGLSAFAAVIVALVTGVMTVGMKVPPTGGSALPSA